MKVCFWILLAVLVMMFVAINYYGFKMWRGDKMFATAKQTIEIQKLLPQSYEVSTIPTESEKT